MPRPTCRWCIAVAIAFLFAAPLLTFSAVMSVAILSMFYAEHARGMAISAVPVGVIGVMALLSMYGAWAFLRASSR